VYDGTSNTLLVSFSEPVAGADSLAAYALTGADGTVLPIESAELLEDGSCRLHIAPGAVPEAGDVTLTVGGLRDVSMEENELYRFSEVVIARIRPRRARRAPHRRRPKPFRTSLFWT
jgi:hypothetical protein